MNQKPLNKLFSFFTIVLYTVTSSLFLASGNLFAQSDERAPRLDRRLENNLPGQESTTPGTPDNLAGVVWYVNDTYVAADDIYTSATGNNSNSGTSSSPFATINHAVGVATAGDTIYVDAGTYTLTSAIIVNKQLTFKGRQAGIDPQDVRNLRTRGVDPESDVDAVNLSGFPTTVFDIQSAASESIIDGFTIQGSKGDQGLGGIWLEAASNGTLIQNNIIQSNHVGIFLANNSAINQTVIRDNLFRDNTFPGPGSGHAIYCDDFTVTNNLQNVLIDDNTFTNTSLVINSWALGLSNTGVTAFTNITFQNNKVSNHGRGMYFFGTTGSAVTGNTFDGATNYAIGLFDGSIPNATITVTGNTFTSNFRGIWVDQFSSAAYTGTLSPTGNIFTVGTYHLINSSTVSPSAIIDAVSNTYDGILLDGSTTLANIYTIADKLLDAIDVGFYGKIILRASNVYVTPNSFYAPEGTTTPSIQRGIDAASAGFIQNVKEGTYVENFIVTKSLDIRGSNYNINPNTGIRIAETILMPAINDPESGVLADIEASNVLINGFLLDGDNPSLGGGNAVGGADVNTSEGIQNGPIGGGAPSSYFQGDHFDIQNNIFNNFDYQAIYFEVAFNSNHSWNYIKNNKFDNMWEGIQTYALHADISFNTFTRVDRAVSMHAVHAATDVGFVPQIADNDVSITWKTAFSRNIGIWVNYRDGSAPPLEVKNNTIDCSDPSLNGQKFFGFYALALLDNRVVTFSNNTIDGADKCSRGFYMTNCPSSNITLTGGAFNNIKDYGILMVNNDLTWGPGDVRLTVTDLPITMSAGASAGILDSTDNAFALNSFTTNLLDNRFNRKEPAADESRSSIDASASTLIAALDISNSTITGAAIGIMIKGTLASANIHDNPLTITGAVIGVDVDGGTATIYRNTITAIGTGVRVRNSGNLTSVTENYITSNTSTGISIEATAGTIGVVSDNNLSGKTGFAINYLIASPALSATCNWYGTPNVASKINGNVIYIPFLIDGNDSNLALPGFQPMPGSCIGPLTKLYVNDNAQTGDVYTTAVGNDANLGTPAAPYLTISFAVSVANTGDTIYVDAGGYPENVLLTKTLLMNGAKAGIDARGRIAGSPSIIIESVISPASGAAIDIQSNSSVIDGFAMTGSVTGSQGVIQTQITTYSFINIKNNYAAVVTGTSGSAVYFNKTLIDATLDKNEFVASSTSTQTIFLDDPDQFNGIYFTNNNVLRDGPATGDYGISVDGNRNVGTSATPRSPLIQGNLFQGHKVGINGGSRAFENAQFLENTFTGNTLDGFQGGPKNSIFARNTFSNNGRDGLVFTSFGNLDPLRGAQGTMVKNNIFSGNVQRDMLIANQGTGTHNTNTITENSFGSDTAIRNNELNGNTDIIHATCNWFGTASAAGVSTKIVNVSGGTVDYIPWLTNGTDDSLGVPGFQPVPNSCNGLPLITGKLDLTVNLEAYSPLPDTIIVTLRSTTTPYPAVAVDTGKLDANGDVSLNFSNVYNGPSYFIVVNHRQSIETWSATGQSFTVNAMTYDFTSAVTQAFGDNMILVSSKASIYTGDVNQDYIVDLNDLGIIDNDVLNIALGPYLLTDLNGDGITDINDMAYADNNAFNIIQRKIPSLRPGERKSTNKKDIFLPTEKEKAKTFMRPSESGYVNQK